MDYKPEIVTETHLSEPDLGRAIKKTASQLAKDIPNQVESMVQEIGKDDSKDTSKVLLLENVIQVKPPLQKFERVLSKDTFYLLPNLRNDGQLIDFVVRSNLIKVHLKLTRPTSRMKMFLK